MILKIILIAAALPAWAEPRPGGPSPAELRRAVALLDYVGGDYPQAVSPEGRLVNADEQREQLGFLDDAAAEVRAYAAPGGEDLARRIDALKVLVERAAKPGEVVGEARAVREELVQRFHVPLLPTAAPSLARGAALWTQACASCHGLDGRPPREGEPDYVKLSTAANAFAAPADVKALAPQRIFSATTFGVPATAMPSYLESLDDEARWDLAFFTLSLAHRAGAKELERGRFLARTALGAVGYKELAQLTDDALRARLASSGVTGDDAEAAVAALRGGPFTDATVGGLATDLAKARRDLAAALALAQQGDREGAKRAVISAYLDDFEPHEPALRARDNALVTEIEREFLGLRTAFGGQADPGPAAVRLDDLLSRAEASGAGGAFVAFVASLTIALREGIEAVLLITVLLALLRKSGREDSLRIVHLGWTSALALGVATWFASGWLLGIGGMKREIAEGVLQLLTAALLVWGSHWLIAAASARKLVAVLYKKAFGGASSAVIFGLAFAAIYREMFEVVVFYRGLLLESQGAVRAVVAGLVAGLAALVVVSLVFQRVGKKLKPKPLLMASSVLLCGLAVVMVGDGVRALQESGVLPLTVWVHGEVPSLGLYGTREGLIAQAAVLVFLVASLLRGRSGGGGEGHGEREAGATA